MSSIAQRKRNLLDRIQQMKELGVHTIHLNKKEYNLLLEIEPSTSSGWFEGIQVKNI